MPEIFEYLHEKLDWAADMIREFLTGSKGYRVRAVKERIPRFLPAGRIDHVAPHDGPCSKY